MVRALDAFRAEGKAARTVNHRGGSVRAFSRWCVRTGRLDLNPLKHLPKLDADRDRKRVRRALTDEELASLFEVGDERGRGLFYRLAFWAGLRLSDLRRLTWGEVDLQRSAIVIRFGKAHRVDEIPIHPALRAALEAAGPGLPTARVFSTMPTYTRSG